MIGFERKESRFEGHMSAPVELEMKLLSEEGEFEGYGSIFNTVDHGGDIVMPGAFSASIGKRGAAGIKMLFQHDTRDIIGKWLEIREDAKGLYCKGRLFLGIQRGREAYELMREKALDGLSIGFRTIVDQWDREDDVRRLIEVDLREISAVTFPMHEGATVSLVKGDQLPTEREFERWLVRDAGFSARQAKAIVASGYKSLQRERDAGTGDETGLLEAIRGLRSSIAAA
ncbi:HK97 family phage prohead protease [Afifella sp. H1R]|uniref:HK97 family phage prohead protease n=1 Tax=Afifella sp. H1R TaxID=2908841 RepID=UPI001F2329DB|nr:HK97 family phage prohead protease [Afifella sp. H1R]MCF1502186.1 HK97 family phage prohead protease [Afifella sp. H1R]